MTFGWFIAGFIVGAAAFRWFTTARQRNEPEDRTFRQKSNNAIYDLVMIAHDPSTTGGSVYVLTAQDQYFKAPIVHEAWPEPRLRLAFEEVYLRDGEWIAKVKPNLVQMFGTRA